MIEIRAPIVEDGKTIGYVEIELREATVWVTMKGEHGHGYTSQSPEQPSNYIVPIQRAIEEALYGDPRMRTSLAALRQLYRDNRPKGPTRGVTMP